MAGENEYAAYEAILLRLGWERTRENFLRVLFDGDVPDELDEDTEMSLPPGLRIT